MKPTALYLRVSTEGQTGDDRYGLASQQAVAERYAAAHDLQIIKVYTDTISGTREVRDGLNQLCTDAAQYDAVLFAALDRLAREMRLTHTILPLFQRLGLEIHSADIGRYDPDDEAATMQYGLFALVAQVEHTRIKKRLRRGMIAKVQAGKPVVPPNGYGWSKGEIVGVEAQWVRQMYRWAREGWSAHQIVTELNRLGVPKRSGARWTHSTVKYMLKNALYRGEYSHGKARPGRGSGQDLVTCEVEAIIPRDEWEATQRALQSRQRGGRAGSRQDLAEFPLAKRLHCGVCGGALIAGTNYPHPARPKQKTPYRFYHCYRIYRRDGYWGEICTHKRYYGAKKIHEFILAQIKGILQDEEALAAAVDHPPAPPVDVGPMVAKIETRLANLKNLALDGGLSPAEYRETRLELEGQRDALLAQSQSPVASTPDVTAARQKLSHALQLDNLGAIVTALDLHATLHPDGRVDIKLLAL